MEVSDWWDCFRVAMWEVIQPVVVIVAMVWIVHRVFILTKRIVKGWGKKEDI